jgi:hypothetical protein
MSFAECKWRRRREVGRSRPYALIAAWLASREPQGFELCAGHEREAFELSELEKPSATVPPYMSGYLDRMPDAEFEKLAAEARSQEEAELQTILDGHRPVAVKKPRKRVQVLREPARQVLAILYPYGIPSKAVLPNKKLVAEVCEYMIEHLAITTIRLQADGWYSAKDTVLRAAGRK